jgi:hypothetical protein
MPNYALNGVCYDQSSDMLDAFITSFPKIDGSQILNLTKGALPVYNVAAGMIQGQFDSQDFSPNSCSAYGSCPVVYVGSYFSLPVQSCNYHANVADYVAGIGIVVCLALGLLYGYFYGSRASS